MNDARQQSEPRASAALFPAPAAETAWVNDPWWRLQLGAYQFAIMIERTIPDGRERHHALRLVRDATTVAQSVVPAPTVEEWHDRLTQTLAPFVRTDSVVIASILDHACVGPTDVVFDLGCGDGGIVCAAACRGAQAIGIESVEAVLQLARARREQQPAWARRLIVLRHGDAIDDWDEVAGSATVVIVYWTTLAMRRWLQMFRRLRPGTRIVSHTFGFFDEAGVEIWPPDQRWTVRGAGCGDVEVLQWVVKDEAP